MHRLSLVRHAEAIHTAAGSLDRHRVLTEDGRATARALGVFLNRESQVPDRVLCSDAVRAVDTAHMIVTHADTDPEVVVLQELYHAGPEEIAELIQLHGGESAKHLMIVGHNPTIGALAQELAQRGNSSPTVSTALSHFEPATCAQFAVQGLEWESFDHSHAELRRVLTPSMYHTA